MSEPMPEASDERAYISVPLAHAMVVTEIANRNEQSSSGDIMRNLLAARLREAAPAVLVAGAGDPGFGDTYGATREAAPAEEVGALVERHVAWLESYAHDLMEEGDFDQEAARLNEAAAALSRLQAERDALERGCEQWQDDAARVSGEASQLLARLAAAALRERAKDEALKAARAILAKEHYDSEHPMPLIDAALAQPTEEAK